MKVSVIVPVYNPGRLIDELLASLARQSMTPEDFEVVFVDDGSSDGTERRLDSLADTERHMRVIHIPNSGWPGRPRNVGIDAAEGDFVLFVDHDDELADEALERMYDYATINSSDVVVGKEGRRNKTWGTGPLFVRNRPNATLEDDPALLLLLTPHKLFRRDFLREHDLRFLEGPRRLEDHAFVMSAYFRARVISVLADYTCYHWHLRHGSAGRRPYVWPEYYASLRDTLDVVEENTSPGPFRDRLLTHWYRTKGLRRLGPGFADRSEQDARALFDALRELTLERFPPHLDEQQLRGLLRLRAALLRAGAFAQLRELAKAEGAMSLREQVDDVRVSQDGLELTVTATLRDGDGSRVHLEEDGGRFYLASPVALGGLDLPRTALDMTAPYERMSLKVYARHQSGDQRFALPGPSSVSAVRADGLLPVRATAHVSLDPSVADVGRPMNPGSWWLQAELTFGGVVVSSPIRSKRVSATFGRWNATVSGGGSVLGRIATLGRSVRVIRRLTAGKNR